jgi:hypothetical protein
MRVKRTEMVSTQHIPKTRCHNSGIRSYLPQWVPLFEPERRALTIRSFGWETTSMPEHRAVAPPGGPQGYRCGGP